MMYTKASAHLWVVKYIKILLLRYVNMIAFLDSIIWWLIVYTYTVSNIFLKFSESSGILGKNIIW